MRYCASFVTLRDDYDCTPEMTGVEPPFSIYPNPVKSQLYLHYSNGTEPECLNLFDLEGRMVGTKSNDMENFNMSALASGAYMLRITLKDGTTYFEKVMRE